MPLELQITVLFYSHIAILLPFTHVPLFLIVLLLLIVTFPHLLPSCYWLFWYTLWLRWLLWLYCCCWLRCLIPCWLFIVTFLLLLNLRYALLLLLSPTVEFCLVTVLRLFYTLFYNIWIVILHAFWLYGYRTLPVVVYGCTHYLAGGGCCPFYSRYVAHLLLPLLRSCSVCYTVTAVGRSCCVVCCIRIYYILPLIVPLPALPDVMTRCCLALPDALFPFAPFIWLPAFTCWLLFPDSPIVLRFTRCAFEHLFIRFFILLDLLLITTTFVFAVVDFTTFTRWLWMRFDSTFPLPRIIAHARAPYVATLRFICYHITARLFCLPACYTFAFAFTRSFAVVYVVVVVDLPTVRLRLLRGCTRTLPVDWLPLLLYVTLTLRYYVALLRCWLRCWIPIVRTLGWLFTVALLPVTVLVDYLRWPTAFPHHTTRTRFWIYLYFAPRNARFCILPRCIYRCVVVPCTRCLALTFYNLLFLLRFVISWFTHSVALCRCTFALIVLPDLLCQRYVIYCTIYVTCYRLLYGPVTARVTFTRYAHARCAVVLPLRLLLLRYGCCYLHLPSCDLVPLLCVGSLVRYLFILPRLRCRLYTFDSVPLFVVVAVVVVVTVIILLWLIYSLPTTLLITTYITFLYSYCYLVLGYYSGIVFLFLLTHYSVGYSYCYCCIIVVDDVVSWPCCCDLVVVPLFIVEIVLFIVMPLLHCSLFCWVRYCWWYVIHCCACRSCCAFYSLLNLLLVGVHTLFDFACIYLHWTAFVITEFPLLPRCRYLLPIAVTRYITVVILTLPRWWVPLFTILVVLVVIVILIHYACDCWLLLQLPTFVLGLYPYFRYLPFILLRCLRLPVVRWLLPCLFLLPLLYIYRC